ncbi:MAG: phospholipase D family protein [Opitutaceae bacterium]
MESAKQTIHVQAYSFTSLPIVRALVAAKKRGVDVEIVLDKSQQSLPSDLVAEVGIPTFIDASHGIAHNKIVIVDAAVVLTGSFNFSKAAEDSNAENLLVIRDALLAGRYLENWRLHQAHSEKHISP